jgi:hypothetical protein
MIKRFAFFSLVFLFSISGFTQSEANKDARLKGWREARLGMFIHRGPYSVLVGVYNGHQQRRGGDEWHSISLPAMAPDAIASVVKVSVKGKISSVAADAKKKMEPGELD